MNRVRKRALLYAALALAVPLPAFALGGGGAARLDTAASLSGCGVQGSEMICTLAVSFNRLPHAEYYTARIAKPDGGTQEYGTVAEGEGDGRVTVDLAVAYAGAGGYTVSIAAWGRNAKGDRKLIERSESEAGSEDGGDPPVTGDPGSACPADPADPSVPAVESPAESPAAEGPAAEGPAVEAPPAQDPAADAPPSGPPAPGASPAGSTQPTDPAPPGDPDPPADSTQPEDTSVSGSAGATGESAGATGSAGEDRTGDPETPAAGPADPSGSAGPTAPEGTGGAPPDYSDRTRPSSSSEPCERGMASGAAIADQ